MGIKDRVATNTADQMAKVFESMSEEEKRNLEASTGVTWEDAYSAQKHISSEILNKRGDGSISKPILEMVEKEDPFKTQKK